MNNLDQLIEQFSKFPGVGTRQAKRFVFFLLRRNKGSNQNLAELIKHIKDNMQLCQESFQYFYTEDPTVTLSPISRDTSRDRKTLMVVEKDLDVEAVEKSGAYHGVYFVLGGLISVTKTRNSARTDELMQRIETGIQKDNLQEIIFGLSLNPESEHTRTELTRKLTPLQQKHGFTISRLGRGLSTGTELEYSDQDTLANALETRI